MFSQVATIPTIVSAIENGWANLDQDLYGSVFEKCSF